jgi:hypothetical protein
MTLEYRLLANQYVLFQDGKQTGRALPQLSLAFDRDNGTVYKHGEPAMVQTWAHLMLKRMVNGHMHDDAQNLVVVTGRWPLDEVNRCLENPSYAAEFFTRLMDGEFAAARVA